MQRLFMECAVRAALIALGTAAVLRLLHVKSAGARHAAWSGVVALMLLLPAWMAWGPRAVLRLLPAAPAPTFDAAPLLLPMPLSMNAVSATVHAAPPTAGLTQQGPLGSGFGRRMPSAGAHWNWLAIAYLAGVFVLLLRLAIGTLRAHALVRRAVVCDGRLTSPRCAAPITIGWLRPTVILPEYWRSWPPAQLDAVLTHEGEHVRRRDAMVQWLALLNRAIFWFHPLAWWLERRLSALAEEACDAAVLDRGHDPRDYSAYLLELARSIGQSGARINLVGMAMPGSSLPRRIRQILASAPAPRVSRTRALCMTLACVAISVLAAANVDRQSCDCQPPVPPPPLAVPAQPAVPAPPAVRAPGVPEPPPPPPEPASSDRGYLVMGDTDNNRVLIWNQIEAGTQRIRTPTGVELQVLLPAVSGPFRVVFADPTYSREVSAGRVHEIPPPPPAVAPFLAAATLVPPPPASPAPAASPDPLPPPPAVARFLSATPFVPPPPASPSPTASPAPPPPPPAVAPFLAAAPLVPPPPASPAPVDASPAPAPPPASPQLGNRMIVLYFDLDGAPAETQRRAAAASAKFIESQLQPNDLVAIMTCSGGVKVVEDFTAERDRLIADLGQLENRPASDAGGFEGLLSATKMLSALREKKELVYFTTPAFREKVGPDQIQTLIEAAQSANVAFYPIDVSALIAAGHK